MPSSNWIYLIPIVIENCRESGLLHPLRGMEDWSDFELDPARVGTVNCIL